MALAIVHTDFKPESIKRLGVNFDAYTVNDYQYVANIDGVFTVVSGIVINPEQRIVADVTVTKNLGKIQFAKMEVLKSLELALEDINNFLNKKEATLLSAHKSDKWENTLLIHYSEGRASSHLFLTKTSKGLLSSSYKVFLNKHSFISFNELLKNSQQVF